MELKRRHLLLTVVALVVTGLVVLVVAPVVGLFVYMKRLARRGERGRKHLFLETDYEELLAACQELLKQMPAGAREHRLYHIHLGRRDPETFAFPRVILDLEPALVRIHYGEVYIELFPGPDWFGVIASSEDQEGRGDVKLIDGLWYCDTSYGNEYPEYVKRINAMIEEGRRIKEKRKPMQTPQ